MRETSNAHARARRNRRQMSLPETILWTALRGRFPDRPAFRRQHPVGPYVLDFYCAQARLCVEVDGAWHSFGDQPERDAQRDAFLNAQGIRVIRCTASAVLDDATSLANAIFEVARDRSAPSTPSGSPSPVVTGEEH